MSTQGLIPTQQTQVVFYDDEITVVQVIESGQPITYFSIRQLCQLLGVSYQGQIRRIQDDAVLSKYVKGVNITLTPSSGRGGGEQTTNCLPVNYINGWLFGINAKRVKEEVRDRLIIYQENCHRVLAEAFLAGEVGFDTKFDELLAQGGDAVDAYNMLQGMVKLARNQILLQGRVRDNSSRISILEAQLGNPNRLISAEQAMHVSQAVKTIALEMSKRSGRNEFQGVYGELYRRFKVPSYRELPATRYDEAMNFLRDWYSSVVGGDVPF